MVSGTTAQVPEMLHKVSPQTSTSTLKILFLPKSKFHLQVKISGDFHKSIGTPLTFRKLNCSHEKKI